MNKPLQQTLWENIRTFAIDDPASDFPFSKKLQKENSWSINFTSAAIEEYKKFIFLCCILPGGASPSDTVDKVWHLHLTYTTNYWIEFCQKTLHKDIHHIPSKGGNTDNEKHKDWYQQTLQQYKAVFGTEPPASIWPRIPAALQSNPVEIYDRDFFNKTVLIFLAATILFIVGTNLFHTKGPDFLVYYFILMVAGLVVSWILQQHKLKKLRQFMDENFPEKCNPFQIADFLSGRHRAYQTALIDLLKRNMIDTAGKDYRLNTTLPESDRQESNPLLPTLTENLAAGDTFSYKTGLSFINADKLRLATFEEFTRLSKEVDYQKFVIPGIVLAIGFARLFQGMANQKPVTLLVVETGFFSLIALMIAARYSYTSLVFQQAKQIWKQKNDNGTGPDLLNNFTLLGAGAITGFAEYNLLTSVFETEDPAKRIASSDGYSYSSCSSSSGCSSSSCGSGCGGCGGS